MNKIIEFFRPLCSHKENLTIPYDENKVFELKIPYYIDFEIKLLFDLLIYSNIYYGVLLLFNPFIYMDGITHSFVNFSLIMLFGSAILGLIIKYHLFYKKTI